MDERRYESPSEKREALRLQRERRSTILLPHALLATLPGAFCMLYIYGRAFGGIQLAGRDYGMELVPAWIIGTLPSFAGLCLGMISEGRFYVVGLNIVVLASSIILYLFA